VKDLYQGRCIRLIGWIKLKNNLTLILYLIPNYEEYYTKNNLTLFTTEKQVKKL
jgi:hypothetical protein